MARSIMGDRARPRKNQPRAILADGPIIGEPQDHPGGYYDPPQPIIKLIESWLRGRQEAPKGGEPRSTARESGPGGVTMQQLQEAGARFLPDQAEPREGGKFMVPYMFRGEGGEDRRAGVVVGSDKMEEIRSAYGRAKTGTGDTGVWDSNRSPNTPSGYAPAYPDASVDDLTDLGLETVDREMQRATELGGAEVGDYLKKLREARKRLMSR